MLSERFSNLETVESKLVTQFAVDRWRVRSLQCVGKSGNSIYVCVCASGMVCATCVKLMMGHEWYFLSVNFIGLLRSVFRNLLLHFFLYFKEISNIEWNSMLLYFKTFLVREQFKKIPLQHHGLEKNNVSVLVQGMFLFRITKRIQMSLKN